MKQPPQKLELRVEGKWLWREPPKTIEEKVFREQTQTSLKLFLKRNEELLTEAFLFGLKKFVVWEVGGEDGCKNTK
jgi:hypothetical protein